MLLIALALAVGLSGPEPPLHCPATLEEITSPPTITMEYAGALYGTSCEVCDAPFMTDPKGMISKAVDLNTTIGAFEYDPITGVRIDPKKAAAFSDFKAIRYYFTSDAEKKVFDGKPAKYVGNVKYEAYFCPMMRMPLEHKDVGGYADYNGVRYYLCCEACTKDFRSNPAKFAAKASAAAKPLAVITVKKAD